MYKTSSDKEVCIVQYSYTKHPFITLEISFVYGGCCFPCEKAKGMGRVPGLKLAW